MLLRLRGMRGVSNITNDNDKRDYKAISLRKVAGQLTRVIQLSQKGHCSCDLKRQISTHKSSYKGDAAA